MDPTIPNQSEQPAAQGAAGDVPEESRGPLSGFLLTVTTLLVTLVEMAYTRFELVFTDLQAAAEDLVGLLLWGFAALAAVAIALFIGGLALIFAFWDTHRVLVSVLLMSAFLGFALIAALIVVSKLRARGNVFAATLREFARDREHFKSRP